MAVQCPSSNRSPFIAVAGPGATFSTSVSWPMWAGRPSARAADVDANATSATRASAVVRRMCVCVCVCEWVGWKVGSKSGEEGGEGEVGKLRWWCEGGEGRRGFYSFGGAARASHLVSRACPQPTPRHCAAWHPPSPPSSPAPPRPPLSPIWDLQKCCRRQRPRPPPRPPPRNRPSPAALPPNPAPFHRLHASALAVPSPSAQNEKKKSSQQDTQPTPMGHITSKAPRRGGGGGM